MAATSVSVVGQMFKKFEPQGCTILYLLSESHISIHTWPEHRSCTIDFYHCGPKSKENLSIAANLFIEYFGKEACTTDLNLSRGKCNSILVNSFENKAEILRNVTLLHEEQS